VTTGFSIELKDTWQTVLSPPAIAKRNGRARDGGWPTIIPDRETGDVATGVQDEEKLL
jgi:hypothetical protein